LTDEYHAFNFLQVFFMPEKDNSGTLGKNRQKDPNNPAHKKWPEYSGSIRIEGKDYWLSGWVREKDGSKFFSLSAKPKN
jgi:hypothetical protein